MKIAAHTSPHEAMLHEHVSIASLLNSEEFTPGA